MIYFGAKNLRDCGQWESSILLLPLAGYHNTAKQIISHNAKFTNQI